MPFLKALSRYLLGRFFIAAGLNHFWHTPFYVAMMAWAYGYTRPPARIVVR